MKKLFVMAAILFLVACSGGMSGATTTTCTDAPGVFTSGETVIIIEGYDEEIRLWTEQTTLTREQLKSYVLEGAHLTDDEIIDMFEFLNSLEIEGSELELVLLDEEEAIIEEISDYTIISNEALSDKWEVDDFEQEIVLSAVIRGLEGQDAVCDTE